MRVLMVNLGYAPDEIGGAEIAVRILARALVECGVRVVIAALSSRGHDWSYDDAGVRVHFLAAHPQGNLLLNPERTLPQRILWNALAEWRYWSSDKMRALVAAAEPDLIHTHNLIGLSRSAWHVGRERGIPVVHTLHDYSLLCPFGNMMYRGSVCPQQCWSCRLATVARRRGSRIPNVVVGNSAFNLNAHLSAGYFPRAGRYVIPNAPSPPVSLSTPAAVVPDNEDGSGPRPLRIGYLGRLTPFKGVHLLLEALAPLRGSGWVAKIAGTGSSEYAGVLEQYARGRDLPVSFLGWRPQDAFFSEIDVLVIPSIFAEPQGMGVLEAACRHVPVIYANLGGLGEVAAQVPGTVPFVGGSADDLRRVLQRFVSMPAELGALGQRTLAPIPLCDVRHFADRYQTIYKDVMRTRPGAPSEPSSHA